MAANSNIEWCDATFNPWIGCTKVSPGCDHCYAARQDAHRKWTPEGWGGPRKRTSVALWRCDSDGYVAARRRVFCASLADWLDNQVPTEWLVDLLELVRTTPHLDWLLLSKRIGLALARLRDALAWVFTNARERLRSLMQWLADWLDGKPPANIWIGATVVDQEEADRDVPKLLQVPARVRFLSMEPLLGPVDLQKACTLRCPNGDCEPHHSGHRIVSSRLNGLHWVICGGESGPGARPLHPDWARSLRDQCAAAGTPYFFKQWGEWLPWSQFTDAKVDDPPEQTRFATREFFDNRWNDVGRPGYWEVMDGEVDDKHCVGRVGKQAAGRLLDGVEHNGFPGA